MDTHASHGQSHTHGQTMAHIAVILRRVIFFVAIIPQPNHELIDQAKNQPAKFRCTVHDSAGHTGGILVHQFITFGSTNGLSS